MSVFSKLIFLLIGIAIFTISILALYMISISNGIAVPINYVFAGLAAIGFVGFISFIIIVLDE